MKKQILDAIYSANTSQLIDINNTYCQSCNMYDDEIYNNDEEFFEMFYPNAGDGLKVAQAVFYGNYNYSHNYVRFNGYGNLESMEYISADNLCEWVDTMAEYIADNFNEFSHIDVFSDITE
jgi:hypothetical protein